MSQVSSSQVSLCDASLDGSVQLIKTELERMIQRRSIWGDVGQARAQEAGIGASEEESHAPAEVGDLVTVGVRNALDQAMQAQAAQVVGQLSRGQLVWGKAQEGCEQSTQLRIGEPLGQKPKSNQGTEQSLDAWVGKAQGRNPLPGYDLRVVDLLKSLFTQQAIVADLLDVQETSVGGEADEPQSGQIFQPFADAKVTRIVDRSFCAQCATLFVILLDARMFIVDMQSWRDSFCDNTSAKAARRGPGNAALEN